VQARLGVGRHCELEFPRLLHLYRIYRVLPFKQNLVRVIRFIHVSPRTETKFTNDGLAKNDSFVPCLFSSLQRTKIKFTNDVGSKGRAKDTVIDALQYHFSADAIHVSNGSATSLVS